MCCRSKKCGFFWGKPPRKGIFLVSGPVRPYPPYRLPWDALNNDYMNNIELEISTKGYSTNGSLEMLNVNGDNTSVTCLNALWYPHIYLDRSINQIPIYYPIYQILNIWCIYLSLVNIHIFLRIVNPHIYLDRSINQISIYQIISSLFLSFQYSFWHIYIYIHIYNVCNMYVSLSLCSPKKTLTYLYLKICICIPTNLVEPNRIINADY